MNKEKVASKIDLFCKYFNLTYLWFGYCASWVLLTIPMLMVMTSHGLPPFGSEYQHEASRLMDAYSWKLVLFSIVGGLGVWSGRNITDQIAEIN